MTVKGGPSPLDPNHHAYFGMDFWMRRKARFEAEGVCRVGSPRLARTPDGIAEIANRHLKNPGRVRIDREVVPAGSAPRVRQVASVVGRAHKMATLGRVLDAFNPTSAIVFCRTRTEVDELTESLNGRGYRAEALHGGLSEEQRDPGDEEVPGQHRRSADRDRRGSKRPRRGACIPRGGGRDRQRSGCGPPGQSARSRSRIDSHWWRFRRISRTASSKPFAPQLSRGSACRCGATANWPRRTETPWCGTAWCTSSVIGRRMAA